MPNKNINVLMIGSDISVQGGMSTVINFYKEFGVFKDKVYYLAAHKRGSVIFRIKYFLQFLIKFFNLLFFEKSLKIVHVHTSYKGSFFRKAVIICLAKLCGKKVIFHLHGSKFNEFYEDTPGFIKKFISFILNISDLILVLSKQWKIDIAAKCSNKNIEILYNPALVRDKVDKNNSEEINVLFMGLMGERKGVFDIIEAAKYIQNPNIKIYLYGDGEVEKVKSLVNENYLQDKILIGGWISGDKIDKAYKKANIYILPSYNEGLPMSILEAMSYGIPVISTVIGGIPDAVTDNVNGFLIQPGDYKALAKKINILADNENLRQEMGSQGHRIAKEKFDISVIASEIRNIYSNLGIDKAF